MSRQTLNHSMPEPARLPTAGGTVASGAPRCTVGLLTWNAGSDGERCVRSLLAQTEAALELIWIDNASADGTPVRLRELFPELPEPFINPANRGFCGGHNQAIAVCRTPYYLALNQDVVLGPDYIQKLCDWMDEEGELAMTSGLILEPAPEGQAPTVYSAGLVFPRARFAFELAMGRPAAPELAVRRRVPGVDGSAMMLRLEVCRRASLPEGEVFPERFFAYGEEVDLAQRLARMGAACGVEGTARATHAARGSGGFRRAAIRARFFRNHWWVTLRNESWLQILRESPWWLRGEVRYWLPEYLGHPWALVLALAGLPGQLIAARRFYRAFEQLHGPAAPRLRAAQALARDLLRQLKK